MKFFLRIFKFFWKFKLRIKFTKGYGYLWSITEKVEITTELYILKLIYALISASTGLFLLLYQIYPKKVLCSKRDIEYSNYLRYHITSLIYNLDVLDYIYKKWDFQAKKKYWKTPLTPAYLNYSRNQVLL